MKVLISNVSCDHCEERLDFDMDEGEDLPDVLERLGWFYVEHGGEAYDFCSWSCLSYKFG
jgi:hypothetical protein